MDYERLASELVRTLRGNRSQLQLSRRLGYRCNVVYTWETGRRWPTATRFLTLLRAVGRDPSDLIASFLGSRVDVEEGVGPLLLALRGSLPVTALARRIGRSRFAVSRWLKGSADPRLPDFLRLIEGTSLRLLDFVAELADPLELTATRQAWRQLEAARSLSRDLPWAQAVLLTLLLEDYRALPQHLPGWIAGRLRIPAEVETQCLQLLADSGQIRRVDGLWEWARVQSVDTRGVPAGEQLKQFWARVGLERLDQGDSGLFSFNLFTVSADDLGKLEALQRNTYRQLRTIVADSEPSEHLVLVNWHLVPLS